MAGSVVQSAFATITPGSGTAQATFPKATTAGNPLVAFCFDQTNSGRTFTVSDGSNVYTDEALHNDTNTATTGAVYATPNTAGGGLTVTIDTSVGTDTAQVCIVEVTGVTFAGLLAAINGAQVVPGTGANLITSGNLSLAATSFLLALSCYTECSSSGTDSIAAGTGFTSAAATNIAVQGWSGLGFGSAPARLEWQASVAAGSVPATFTDATLGGTAGNAYMTWVIAFPETSAPSTGPTYTNNKAAATESYVEVAADSTGKLVDNFAVTDQATFVTKYRQTLVVADPVTGALTWGFGADVMANALPVTPAVDQDLAPNARVAALFERLAREREENEFGGAGFVPQEIPEFLKN